ncbi:Alpha/Beta hydrolase protein [Bombardia bombarda]|uniref:Carboxylic ester hydrolase n=1 Tax=Bombardia bombarda TaxID=252184 RepID=A0AA39XMI3_9PEZI|nr:Alpha/Beta hydrolase protein [Bombardia bombarda]
MRSAITLLALSAVQALALGGDLTILSRNKLDGAQNDGSAAILCRQPIAYYAAKVDCILLGEDLWNPDTANFNDTLAASLNYEVYQGVVLPTQSYWISKVNESDDGCRAIDGTGQVHAMDCGAGLPALCTNTAPVSTSSFANNSQEWQVSHWVGDKIVTGYRDYHTWKFRGLRYADQPQRFGYSTASSFDEAGDVDATTAGADCSQPIGEVKNGSSEDCLFANVWTPYLPSYLDLKNKRGLLKPVMLYLYGGGLTSGSGKNPNTDGTNLASHGDVVVVSVNYRVGSLGFLNFNDGVHNGNYGISDMVSALEWVHKYIDCFGGDPDRVTVFGESSGAQSTHILLGVEKAKGLFHRAIMQSGPDGYPSDGKLLSYPYYDTLEHNFNTTTKAVLQAAGCLNATDQIACLGKFSGFDLVNLATNANGVVVDGTYLTYHELVVNQTAASYATNVSIMAGVNRDEAGVNIDEYPSNTTTFADYFNTQVGNHFSMPSNASVILNLTHFPNAPGAGGLAPTPDAIFNASLRIATNAVFTCFNLAKAYSGTKHRAFKSVYSFQFNRTYQTTGYTRPWCVPPRTEARPDGDPDAEYYKCHAGEQMIVFGTARRAGRPERDGLDVPFMQLVVEYWASFARTGDPNPDREYLVARGHRGTLEQVDKVGRWEAVDAERPTMRVLQWDGKQVPFVDQDVCGALGAPMDVLEA